MTGGWLQRQREVLREGAGSLKLRLAFASALIIVASVLGVTAVVQQHSLRSTEDAVLDHESANAALLAAVLRERVVRLQLAMRAVATPVADDLPSDGPRAERFLRQRQVLSTLFARIVVVRADGQVLAAREGTRINRPDLNVADRPYFRHTLQLHRPVVSEPLIDRLSREPVLVLTMPIEVADPARPPLLLLGTLRLADNELLNRLTGADQDGIGLTQTVIVDAGGVVLAHPDPGWLMKPAEDVPGLEAAMQRWVQAGRPVEPLPDARQDADHVVAQAGVAGADWMVFRLTPVDRLLGGVHRALREAFAYGAAVAALACVFLWFWLARLLRPLDLLEQRARALGPEGLPLEVGWPDAPGEVGSLERVLRSALREQRRAEVDNTLLLDKLRSVMGTAPLGLAFTRARLFELVSDEWCRLLGYPAGALVGEPARLIYASEDAYEQMGLHVAAAFTAQQPYVADFEFLRRDGSRFVGELSGRPVNGADAAAGTIWLLRDVTAERAAHRELAWSATHDALTGLVNRRGFEAEMARVLEALAPDQTAAALFIDLDHFKPVNDTAGHAAGDAVLREVAHALTGAVRRDELIARLGGDEFAVVLAHCDLAAAEHVALKVQQAVAAVRVRWDAHLLGVGASVGVVEIPHGTTDLAAVLQAADLACYEAKQAGRNAVRIGRMAGGLRLVGRL